MNVSCRTFIKELLKPAPPGSCAWITTFACDPGMAGGREWGGWLYDPKKPLPRINGENAYVSIAGFERGATGRRLKQPHHVVAIIADDVGTKADRDEVLRVLGAPSAVIETSPGNFQYWYFLDAPITDAQTKLIFDALKRMKALSDLSGLNAVRYGRLNTGINTKPVSNNFAVHSTEWNPDLRRSFAYFEERLDLTKSSGDAAKAYVRDPTTDADLRACFARGRGRHDAMIKLSSRWAARGMAADDIKAALHALINESPPGHHAAELHTQVTKETNEAMRKFGESRRALTAPDKEPNREPIKLLAFTLEELRAPLREEKYLIDKLIPTDAYSLIAGALSSYKTFFLIYLMIRRATGYDLLSTITDFDDESIHSDAGPCVLLTYEDIDWRIANRVQLIAQYGEQLLKKRHGAECANKFMADIAKNLRRVPLSGEFSKTIIVRGEKRHHHSQFALHR